MTANGNVVFTRILYSVEKRRWYRVGDLNRRRIGFQRRSLGLKNADTSARGIEKRTDHPKSFLCAHIGEFVSDLRVYYTIYIVAAYRAPVFLIAGLKLWQSQKKRPNNIHNPPGKARKPGESTSMSPRFRKAWSKRARA